MENQTEKEIPEEVSEVQESIQEEIEVQEEIHEQPASGYDPAQHIKSVIESLLFVNEKPITINQFREALPTVTPSDVKQVINALKNEYEQRKSGMAIVEIAGGFQMLSNPLYVEYIRSFYKTKHKEKLSKPALESLAIIAYKQPVTRSDIEVIRGVNSDGVVAHLFNKDLIKIVGKKDVPGRPFLYGTTKQFLEYFGLKSLEDLPKLEEFSHLLDDKEEPSEEIIEEQVESIEAVEAEAEAELEIESEVVAVAEGAQDNEDIKEDKV